MFPNIDNNLGIKAVTNALNSREFQIPSTECIVEAVKICLEHNNSHFQDQQFLQTHGTAMGPKNACSYADLAMGIIDQKAKSGETKPKLWCRYRDDIFDLWTQGTTKLKDFTEFINSLYPTIKFTMVSSEISLNVLDLTLLLVDGFIQTDIYSKPTDHHIYLVRNSAHPSHCTRAIPFGVAEERNKEYQNYLVDRGYHPSKVKTQFDKAKDSPGRTFFHLKNERKRLFFPLWLIFTHICPTLVKSLSRIAISFMIHRH